MIAKAGAGLGLELDARLAQQHAEAELHASKVGGDVFILTSAVNHPCPCVYCVLTVHDLPDVHYLTRNMSAGYHPCVRLLFIAHMSAVYHPYPCINFARDGKTMSAKRPREIDNELG